MSKFGSRTGRARAARASVLLPASVVTMNAYQFPELLDISQTGAKLRGPSLPPVNTTGLLRVGSFQALCRVVWVADERCGVRFEELVSPKTLKEVQLGGADAVDEMGPSDACTTPTVAGPVDGASARLLAAAAEYQAIASTASQSRD